MNATDRRYDLDWIRVFAIILVLYFHVAMIFTEEWGWHIKNGDTSYAWLEFNVWLSRFRMPLLFFISGVGCYFALKKRSGWKFLKERHNRLMIPLVFAMFVIVPPQIYFERIFQGESFSSYLAFLPSVFEFKPYPEGNFSWHHMWFVLYLFMYSAICLPFFLWAKTKKGLQFFESIQFLGRKYWIYTLTIPTVLIYAFWSIRFDRTNALVNDFGYFPYWMTFFFVGFVIACSNNFWLAIERIRRTSLGMALLLSVGINVIRWNQIEPWMVWEEWEVNPISYLYLMALPLSGWMWLLAILGYGKKHLNRPGKLLSYCNQAIYPFYILHQTIIIMIGFYVIQIQETVSMKYFFVSTTSFILTVAIYEYLIRPFRITRFLFGVKPEKRKSKDFSILEERAEFKAA